MNGSLPSRNRRNRSGAACGQFRHPGFVLGAVRLVSGVAHSRSGTETRKAAGADSGGCRKRARFGSIFNRIGARAVFPLHRYHGESHLLRNRPGQEAAHRMPLPASGLHQLLAGDPAGPFQQSQDLRSLAALAGTLRLRRGFRRLLGEGGLLPRGCGNRRDVGRLWRFGCRRGGLGNYQFVGFRGGWGEALDGFSKCAPPPCCDP